MNYYWFNRQEIFQKPKENYSQKKAVDYYKQNKEAIKEKAKEHQKNLSQEEKDKIKEYQKKKKNQELVQYKKQALKINKVFYFFLNIKMTEKTLQFNNIRLNKKHFVSFKNQLTYFQQTQIKQLYLTNLNIMAKVLSILLVIQNVKLLNHYALFYLK